MRHVPEAAIAAWNDGDRVEAVRILREAYGEKDFVVPAGATRIPVLSLREAVNMLRDAAGTQRL